MPPRRAALTLLLLPLAVFQVSVTVPQLRDVYERPGFDRVVIAALALLAALFLLSTVRSLRGSDTRRRLAWLAMVALGAGLIGFWIFRTNPVRMGAVRELIHIVEFGLLGWIAVPAMAALGFGRGAWWLVLVYAGAVGVLDETVQHLHPIRRGDIRDVLTNLSSAALGLAYARGVRSIPFAEPPRRSVRRWGLTGTALLLGSVVAFYGEIHTGFRLQDPDCGEFLSRFDADELRRRAAVSEDHYRAIQQRDHEKPVYAIADHYLLEVRDLVVLRNGLAPHPLVENCVIEKYYRSAAAAMDAREPAMVPQRPCPECRSLANRHLQTRWSRSLLRRVAGGMIGLGLLMGILPWVSRQVARENR